MNAIADIATRPRLLDRLDQIDAGWLTAVLHQSGHADADVVGFAVTPIGAGNVSDTVRVDLTHRHPGSAPRSLVCKFRCSGEQAHAHGISSGSYYRETGSFPVIAGSCRTPRLHWVAGGHDNINLVMEDLSRSTRAGDQIAGCGPDDARAVVTELAKLHRTFYPMPIAAAPDWAMTMAATADYWSDAIDRALPLIREHAGVQLTAQEMATVAAIGAAAHRWYTLPVARATLTHGDPRVDNILFLDREDRTVEAVLIDWQMTGWRNPMHDVGYFLSGSVTVEDRRAHERDLLAHYAAVFGDGYPPEQITRDYRVQLLSGLVTTTAAYALLPLTDAVQALLLALIRRNLAAAIDWDSIAAIDE
ncbi:aminoglycoside phosphotransferase family protein [Sphingomonas adhaesiva]|uniref:aminoglycoside phosphotransferase family protein n=1 Tax=Sphingomonas adhaesiva TaxID=28212 RepID=UPI002FF8DAD9